MVNLISREIIGVYTGHADGARLPIVRLRPLANDQGVREKSNIILESNIIRVWAWASAIGNIEVLAEIGIFRN